MIAKFPLVVFLICLFLAPSINAQAIEKKDKSNFLFNPTKLSPGDFSLSINGGLPLPNLGFRTTFPMGNVDGHLFYYYYLGGLQFIRPEIDFYYTDKYKLIADIVLSDGPFLNTDTSTWGQSFNLVAGGIVAQFSSFTQNNCLSGQIGFYKANTAISNTKVNNIMYIGIISEDKEADLKRGSYHKLGVYLPVSSQQTLVYPSYTFGYIFY